MENLDIKETANYLEMNGNIAFLIGVHKLFPHIGETYSAELCNTYNEGVCEWASFNISKWESVSNKNFYGWIIHFKDTEPKKMVIPIYIYGCIRQARDWNHAKHLFLKYLKRVK